MDAFVSLKLLRLIPVISSTTNLVFAHDEYIFLNCWIEPQYRERANNLLPSWFARWMQNAVCILVAGFSTSFISGTANIFTSSSSLLVRGADRWYWAGTAFSLGYFLWGPTALKLLDDIRGDRPKGNSTLSMEKWLRMHAARTLAVDLPACVCFVVGFLMTIEIV